MRVITLGNQKGGVGKTQMTANLAGALAEAGQRVLAIDLDSQAQLFNALGAREVLQYDEESRLLNDTISDLLDPPRRGAPSLWEVRVETTFENLHFIPAADDLDQARRALEDAGPRGDTQLARILHDPEVEAAYDWVVIDTAPKLDKLLDNALAAADYVICITGADIQQVEPAAKFVRRVNEVRESINPNVQLLGLLFNRVKGDWRFESEVMGQLAEDFPVFDLTIGQRARITKTYMDGPVTFVAPGSSEADLFRALASEMIARIVSIENEGE